ncbi:MAG: hypothetical protein WBZ36_00575 [Candidatus Nitrosopolaris sp.]|jgi:hypothetical protein
MLTEFLIRNIKMKQNQEGVCAVPDCKGKPSFGPILMPNDLTFKEAYLCVGCKELLVREVIERVIAKDLPFEMLNN